MSDNASNIICAVCGSTHTSVREVDARERTMWVDCQDCQRLSSQPYPQQNAIQGAESSDDPEPYNT